MHNKHKNKKPDITAENSYLFPLGCQINIRQWKWVIFRRLRWFSIKPLRNLQFNIKKK